MHVPGRTYSLFFAEPTSQDFLPFQTYYWPVLGCGIVKKGASEKYGMKRTAKDAKPAVTEFRR